MDTQNKKTRKCGGLGKKDREGETEDYVTYQNGMRITNAQPKN